MKPFGWYDRFNDVLHRNLESAQAAMKGGNEIVPLYALPSVSGRMPLANLGAVQKICEKVDRFAAAIDYVRDRYVEAGKEGGDAGPCYIAIWSASGVPTLPISAGELVRFFQERRAELLEELIKLGVEP